MVDVRLGDEMNAHLGQNIMAEIELKQLCTTVSQIISPSSNKPIIGIFQDNLLGSFRFTRPNIKITPKKAMNYLMKFQNVKPEIFKKRNDITNFEILSQFMPPLSLKYETKLFDKDEDKQTSNNVLEIQNGQYLRGQMETDVLMGGSKGIVHRIFNDYGQEATADFIDNLQNVITEYMKDSAYSVGINDLIANKRTYEEIADVIKNRKSEVKQLIDEIHLGIYKNSSGDKNIEDFELRVNNILNKATEDTGKIGRKSLNPNNRFLMIVKSGSKGKEINLSQMICCLGQQNVDGKRVPYGFDNRTLPHFQKYDDSPVSRGFVENSYISGLTATDLFFHAMCGRIGLIDVAVKSVTWETPVLIIENNKPLYTEIGKWIDAKLANDKESVKHYTEQNMEYLDLDSTVYIPTTNDDGVMTWGELTAVTRHDPGDKLYEVTTLGGRNITVTASKSLLIWKPDTKQFLETPSKDVNVGDFMPVTMNLPRPPLTKGYVDMADYLPKNEYIYGTDFHIALKMMNEVGTIKLTESKEFWKKWWNDNNTNTFTLPYKDKKTFSRAVRDSNIQDIKEGFIYNYGSVRKDYLVPEQFELNEINGRFIGLFLADGNVHNGTISITKNNESVKTFIKEWFDLYKINYYIREKNDKSSRGTSFTGNCSILATFINKFVGFGSYNKFVPTEAFTAPPTFMKGIISGYISGDGHVTESSVISSSVSKRLIEGIAMLGNYLGMFCKITTLVNENKNTKKEFNMYKLSFRGKWGTIFANEIELIENDKQTKLNSIKCTAKHQNFDFHNDCVLDKIVTIKEIGVDNNPKMYDVTVPSTLNFAIFNGINTRDTSSTGYIQRRIIKGMEDLKVEYDMTVRNSFGKIIQFAYGENGFDPAKDETQNIPLISMTIEEIYQHYNIAEEEITKEIYTKDAQKLAKQQTIDLKSKSKQYINMMIESRKTLIEEVFQYKDESAVKIPVHIERTIQTIQGNLNINANSLVDITPLAVYEMVEDMFERIQKMFSFMPSNTPFKILYFYYLSPKYLLQKKRFNKYGIQLLLEKILLKWKESIITPGEMVGVIAGQSIGEPTTQMTLNSFHTSSGSASKGNVLSGVPRVEELLRLTKNPKTPSLTIFLKEKDRYEQSNAQHIANMIEYTKLADLIVSSQICFDPKEDATVIPEDEQLLREFYKYEDMINRASGNTQQPTNNKSKWIVRLELDTKILLDKNITMNDIHFAITNSTYGNDNNLTCVYSDLNSDKLIFRIRIGASLFQKQAKRANKSVVPLDDQDDINLLKSYQNALLNNIVLRGIQGVKNVIPRKMQNYLTLEDGNYVKKNVWILDTTGSNLMDVLSLDYIDTNNTYTNDVREVFDVLGVFAARQILYEEFVNVMSPTYINYHHLSLLCDRIMSTKELVPIYRTGIQNDNIGPIAKATFETHTEELLKASKHAEMDPVKGVSSNIMMGQLGFFGTNSFELLFDTEQLKGGADEGADDTAEETNPFSELYEKATVMDSCSKQIIEIDNGVANLTLKGPEYFNQMNKCIMEDEYEDDMGF
jgi:DNA-directed RNA polymerase beta' subunit/sporulation protein YlmC with PRC-barrel domain